MIKHLASWENTQTLSLKMFVKRYRAYHSNISEIKIYVYKFELIFFFNYFLYGNCNIHFFLIFIILITNIAATLLKNACWLPDKGGRIHLFLVDLLLR